MKAPLLICRYAWQTPVEYGPVPVVDAARWPVGKPMHFENPSFLNACNGEPVNRPPVWIMRQAGRYLPEYRAIRARRTFREVCSTPELATEVTLQPIRRFDLDAAIVFSDILVLTEAMGVPFEIVPNRGPVMERTIRTAAAVNELRVPDPEETLAYQLDAIRMICSELGGRIPLIGFAGAPLTLACYLIEGGPSRDFSRVRRFFYEQPEVARQLLSLIARSISGLLRAQVRAGAAAVQLFESWAGTLSPHLFREIALPAIRTIFNDLEDLEVPRILYMGSTGPFLDDLNDFPCEVVSVDWRTDLTMAAAQIGASKVLQGNMDPCALFLEKTALTREVTKVLDMGTRAKGHIFNLGHGILKETDPDALDLVVDTVHAWSSRSD